MQVLDPTYIDDTKNYDNADGAYTMADIEFNANGKRTAYWLYNKNPRERMAASSRVPKEDVIHIYEEDDPGQVRGIPFGTASMLRLRDFDDYEDAQLIRQKIAACFSVFITENADTLTNAKDYEPLEKVEPGIIEHLPPGKTVTLASPPGAEGYDTYSRQVLQGISAGFGVSYEALTNDLSNVNFSSGRMGWIEFQRNIEDWQWLMLIPVFCDKAWIWFMEAAYLSGLVKVKTCRVSWTAPRREMIDPVKETKALSELVRNGFDSWHNAVKSLGENPADVLEQIKKDAKAFDDAKLKPACDPRYDHPTLRPTAVTD